MLDTPTVGCAKSRLCGEHGEPGPEPGDSAPLLLGGRAVGVVLRTRRGIRPLYVSPGHLCDTASAARLVLDCRGGYRSPEPLRRAHALVTRLRAEAGAGDRSLPIVPPT
jgi:deoxyribonuclease V